MIFLPQFSNIWGQHIKTGFHKSQGTEIRSTDWSTPILIQLINAQPENNKGCPWHPLKTFDEYFQECIKNKTIPKDTPFYLKKALVRAMKEYDKGIKHEKSALQILLKSMLLMENRE